jgi:hypothetical protein
MVISVYIYNYIFIYLNVYIYTYAYTVFFIVLRAYKTLQDIWACKGLCACAHIFLWMGTSHCENLAKEKTLGTMKFAIVVLSCAHPAPAKQKSWFRSSKKRQFLILKGHPEGRWYFHHPIKLLRLYGDYVSPNIPKSWIVIPSPYNFSSYLPHQVFGNTPFSVLFCNSQCRRLWPCLGVRVEGRAGGGRSVWIWLWPMG